MRSRDLENIYVMTMLSLELSPQGSQHVKGIFTKNYAYSFTVDEAVRKMTHLTVEINSNSSTTTTISCGIRRDSAMVFLQRFMAARLVHCPADRTRQEPKAGSQVLQPTAKGVHLIERYSQRNGIHSTPALSRLWASNYNSMRCVALDRQPDTDKVIKSDALIYLLYQRFLGPKPNVYNAMSPPDDIPVASKAEGLTNNKPVSPYAHRYFTHPESDSLSQYYVSSKGVRLFDNKVVARKEFDYVMTGRACWQWLMECTDVMHPNEASDLASMFLKYGLIECVSSNTKFDPVSKDVFYTITPKGRKMSLWQTKSAPVPVQPLTIPQPPQDNSQAPQTTTTATTTTMTTPPPSASSQKFRPSRHARDLASPTAITLDEVLEDAGLRLLFREHLSKEFCEENLLFFTELKSFLAMAERGEKFKTVEGDLVSMAYAIYNRFLAPGAPMEININHGLKSRLVATLAKYDEPHGTEDAVKREIVPLFREAVGHVYKMMERDSLPKFVRSREFVEKVKTVAPWMCTVRS